MCVADCTRASGILLSKSGVGAAQTQLGRLAVSNRERGRPAARPMLRLEAPARSLPGRLQAALGGGGQAPGEHASLHQTLGVLRHAAKGPRRTAGIPA